MSARTRWRMRAWPRCGRQRGDAATSPAEGLHRVSAHRRGATPQRMRCEGVGDQARTNQPLPNAPRTPKLTPMGSQSPPEPGLQGQMLIATPAIGDPRFDRSLIYVCSHTPDYAMGIIVNRALEGLRLPGLLEQLDIGPITNAPDHPVLNGGPVDRDRGFVLHSDDYGAGDGTIDVGDGIGLTATKDVLEAIVSPTAPRRSILALGYSGWGPGQLESEIQANAWLICCADEDLIFSTNLKTKWADALNSIGVAPEKLSGQTGQA